MSKFKDPILKVNSDLLEFIKKYEILDEKEPIDNNLLAKLKKLIQSLNTSAFNNDKDLEKKLEAFQVNFDSIMTASAKQVNSINKNLNTALEGIKDKYKKKRDEYDLDIANLKKKSDEDVKYLYQDIDYYLVSSKQREAAFMMEYEENIKRYNYQIESAKENYKLNIAQFNTEYVNNDNQVKVEYNESLENYDISTKKLIERLEEKIEIEMKNLAEVNKSLNKVRLQMKEKFHQESVTLNSEIKTLVEQKNNEIVDARDIYTKALATSATDKTNKKNDYQAESQKILKDYVYNVTELDDYSNECKNIYVKDINKEKMEFYCDKLNIIKKENNEVKEIVTENSKYDDSEKYTKKLIKQRHKYYYSLYNNTKTSRLKRMTEIEVMYQSEAEQTRNSKALLDLEKNYSLKVLTEKEQSDNKYYQELDSIYENDMNLLIKIANMKFNQQANLIKCKSRIRSKSIERELDFNEATLQKEIEKIQNSIDKYQYEITGANALRDILHNYEINKFNLRHNHLTVANLLEIEKCKVLQNYNTRQYNYNVLTSKVNLDYSKNKLALENDKFKELTEINASINKSILRRDVISIAYKIKENQIYEDEDKQIQNRNSQYQIDSINHAVLYNRFRQEIKIINQVLSTFIIQIRDLEQFIHRFFSIFFDDIQLRPEYMQLIRIFVSSFKEIVENYYIGLTSSFNSTIDEIISKRVDFEEKFKFQSYYSELLKQYEADNSRLIAKDDSINATLDNYEKTIEVFNSRIYNFKNQNNLIRQKMFGSSKDAKADLLKKFNSNKAKCDEFSEKILEISKLKSELEHEQLNVNDAIKTVEKDYNKRVAEIKLMQYNSAISFYNLKDSITKISNDIKNIVADNPINLQIKYFHIQKYIDKMVLDYKSANTRVFKKIYEIINGFTMETKESIDRDKKLLFVKFRNDLNHINKNISALINENNIEYNKNLNVYLTEINRLSDNYRDQENRFNNKLMQNERDYQKDINKILDEKGDSLTQFYKEYYGMCDNLETTDDLYNHNMQTNNTDFQNQKTALTKKIIKDKTNSNIRLADFNRSKEELINHLPQAEKFFATQVNKETKDLNLGIENEIKELKSETLNNKRVIQKNITSIENTLEQTILKQMQTHQRGVAKEKRNHQVNLKKIERTKFAEEI